MKDFMKDIIVAYPSKKTALHLCSILNEGGCHVSHVCALGSSVLQIASSMHAGVVVCAASLSDMRAEELADHLPYGFDVLAIGSGVSGMSNLVFMYPPLDYTDFINTALVLSSGSGSTARQNAGAKETIDKAKRILACTRGFSEAQAHRYLQRTSMDCGKKIEAVAQEIIDELL